MNDSVDNERHKNRMANKKSIINTVLLDELNTVLKLGFLDQQRLFDTLNNRPLMQHAIITDRGAPVELIEMADTATKMREVKHAYQAGIKAQIGIEP